MTDQDIAAIADNFSNEFGLEVKEVIPFARAIIEADRAEQGRALHQAGANDMTDNLPPLPSPKYGPDTTVDEDDDPRGAWSYDQVRAAIDAALAARGAVPALSEQIRRIAEKLPNVADCDGPQAELLRIARHLENTQQVASPVQPTLLRDLAEELGMSVPALAGAISRKGLGYYSTNMEVTNDVIGAMRADFAQAKPEQAAQPTQAACEQTTKKALSKLSISDEQAEAIASEVYARNPVDGVDAAFKLDWELVRAGISHAKALSTDDSCPHGNSHIVHDCLRCGAPVCCGKCCADDSANETDVAGEIAYQLTKKLVIDMPTARAAVDAAIAVLPVAQPLTPTQRRALIDEAGDKTDGLNQDDFADEIVRAVERHHGIAAPQPKD